TRFSRDWSSDVCSSDLLAIPPSLFATVITGLAAAGLSTGARVILEKPFGRDLTSAHHLNRIACSVFSEDNIYRIDHFLGKEAIRSEERRVGKARSAGCS